MYKYRIEQIKLKTNNPIMPKKINIIIGPNNSGKSLFLRELFKNITSNKTNERKIISDIDITYPATYQELINSYDLESKIFIDVNNNKRIRTYTDKADSDYFTYPVLPDQRMFDRLKSHFMKDIGLLFVSYLKTENRLITIKKCEYESNGANFLTDIHNQCIYNSSEIIKELRSKLKLENTFNKDIELDHDTEPGKLFFRVGDDLSYYYEGKRNDYESSKMLSKENILDNEGDGLKSFVSTFLTLNSLEKNIILIDEPEAFLHPPLARQMGEIIGENSLDNKQIFVATHSSEILKGILSKSSDVNIIKIDREKDVNFINCIDTKFVNEIIKNPRFRVSKVLDGLFCKKVALTEAEADEIFYQEYLEQIKPFSGTYFTHANNKQSIIKIKELYNKLNVNSVMIFDFDIIRKNDEFSSALFQLEIDEKERQGYLNLATEVRTYIENLIPSNLEKGEKDKIKGEFYYKKGIRCLSDELKLKCIEMFKELAKNGMLILENGELETTLEEVGIKKTKKGKNDWIEKAIEFISNEDEEKLNSLKIADFIKRI